MPEGDRFEKSLRAWRRAYNYAKDEGAPPEETGDQLSKILVEEIRSSDVGPVLSEITQIIVDSSPEVLLDSFSALDRIVREQKGHIYTKVAAEIAKSIAFQSPSLGTGLDGQVFRHLAERACEAIVENGFFAKAGTRLVEEGRFANHQEFNEWKGRVERVIAPSIAKIADSLSRNPDAKSLRAPNRISKKRSTSEILRENLL